LVQRRRDLETLYKDLLLSLESNVFRPSDESGKVHLVADRSSDSEVLGGIGKQDLLVGILLGSFLGRGRLDSNLLGDLGLLGSSGHLVMRVTRCAGLVYIVVMERKGAVS
jgi:hypothetical protein